MHGRDPHQALKHDVIGEARSASSVFRLARLQWSKADIGFSLHVGPHTFSMSGFQITDLLSLVGFHRSTCPFLDGRQCYVRWVEESFDIAGFAASLDNAYSKLTVAQSHLEACGVFLNQPEGWAYFTGKQSRRTSRDFNMPGDGHTAMKVTSMKKSEDATFMYRLSWLESMESKGWVIHYRPKHLPLSSELSSVLSFLNFRDFSDCSEFDFESCSWRSIAFEQRGDGVFDSNAESAHRWFDSHSSQFSLGIEGLLGSNAALEKFRMGFLPLPEASARLNNDIEVRVVRPVKSASTKAPQSFDVAISFAGSERVYANVLATKLKEAGYSVFFDDFFPEYLWGKNLVDTFDEVYRKRAKYCVMFISSEYKARAWTNHERKSAQARALLEKGNDYILPIRIDDTEIDGMPPTVGYLPISMGIDEIANLLIRKLRN